MSKFVCRLLGGWLQTERFRPFAERCVKLVVKYHLISSGIRDKFRSRNDFYYDLDTQFA